MVSNLNLFLSPQVRYAEQDHYYSNDGDSSMNSSQVSTGIDDYLDEALVGDYGSTQEDDTEDEQNASQLSLGVSSLYSNLFLTCV